MCCHQRICGFSYYQDLAGKIPTYIPKMNICSFGSRKKSTSMYFKISFNFFDHEINLKFSCVFQLFLFFSCTLFFLLRFLKFFLFRLNFLFKSTYRVHYILVALLINLQYFWHTYFQFGILFLYSVDG